MSNKAVIIVVLGDGETWGVGHGASVCAISPEEYEKLCEGKLEPKDLHPLAEFALTER